jgi:uncharacterized protein
VTRFTWDENKNRANCAKHRLSFETAAKVFIDPDALMRQDRDIDGEPRWQTIGCVHEDFLVVLVAHTLISDDGDELIRIISARHATSRERRLYEEGEDND